MAKSILDDAYSIVRASKDERGKCISTSQIRKFLSEVVRISNMIEVNKSNGIENFTDDIQLAIEFLDVKLMYQVGRESYKKGPLHRFYEAGDFKNRIKKASDSVEYYGDFAKLMEAVVAIYKYEVDK